MTELLGEGGVPNWIPEERIRSGLLPWLEGFADREIDIYQPIATQWSEGTRSARALLARR
jgi:hypothetical protein